MSHPKLKTLLDIYGVEDSDTNRPWGSWYLIKNVVKFIELFPTINSTNNISPKLLVVNPKKRLSWQYHHRRDEIWKVIQGPVAVILSGDNHQTPFKIYNVGEIINIPALQRHRLIGLSDIGIVAEIWKHVDSENPSDENDIVRVSDDFGR